MKRFRWAILIPVVLVAGLLFLSSKQSNRPGEPGELGENKLLEVAKIFDKGNFPECPANLEGILTHPLMEPKYIAALTPLGNINPPGHTSPVDHVYFATDYPGKIPLYAPADSTITGIIVIKKDDGTGKYMPQKYVVQYTVCDGLVLDFANHTDIIKPLKDELARQGESDCQYGIVKPGHEGGAEGQCSYRLNYPVKSGDEIGWVQAGRRSDFPDQYDLQFEIWAANYNIEPPEQTNWDYYDDDRYAHIICPFDLYSGELKKSFYDKFGFWNWGYSKEGHTVQPHLISRTTEPRCGQVDQDITGTIQGMWFGGAPSEEGIEFQGKGLAFLHDNTEPSKAEISIGGYIMPEAGIFMFHPKHSGTFNREPSEVKADGRIYCFSTETEDYFRGQKINGKILVRLVDNHHLLAEYRTGDCSGTESLSNPKKYER